MKRIGFAAAVVVALVFSGCAPKRLDVRAAGDLRRLAVVARATKGPTVRIERAKAEGSDDGEDRALVEALARQVRPFEMAERMRASLLGRMPASPPWTQVMAPIEVATALDALLVVDATVPIDFDALRRSGADSVLLLEVSDYGVHGRGGQVGLFMTGQGRLMALEGGTLWSGSLDCDDLAPGGEASDLAVLSSGGFRDAIIELVERMSARVAPSLAGER